MKRLIIPISVLFLLLFSACKTEVQPVMERSSGGVAAATIQEIDDLAQGNSFGENVPRFSDAKVLVVCFDKTETFFATGEKDRLFLNSGTVLWGSADSVYFYFGWKHQPKTIQYEGQEISKLWTKKKILSKCPSPALSDVWRDGVNKKIDSFSSLDDFLNKILKKNPSVYWSEEAEEALVKLKKDLKKEIKSIRVDKFAGETWKAQLSIYTLRQIEKP